VFVADADVCTDREVLLLLLRAYGKESLKRTVGVNVSVPVGFTFETDAERDTGNEVENEGLTATVMVISGGIDTCMVREVLAIGPDNDTLREVSFDSDGNSE
jgi:hypothetical protein